MHLARHWAPVSSRHLHTRSCLRTSPRREIRLGSGDPVRYARLQVPKASWEVEDAVLESGDLDFYALLDVSPAAVQADIKKAYYRLMRELHPDRGVEGSEQICIILNEVYDVLGNPETRLIYDAVSGFVSGGLNPFKDISAERDQVFVDEVSCIGCGKCVRHAPCTFEIEASKYGRARVIAQGPSQGGEGTEDVQIAMETCPVDCIHWVSLPQLALLETALAKMGRIDVFVMQRTGRSAGDVFAEANKAWTRRQDSIDERLQQAAASDPSSFTSRSAGYWGAGGPLDSGQQQQPVDPKQRDIAKLAASAARAARLWRMQNKTQGRGVLKAITDSCSSTDGVELSANEV